MFNRVRRAAAALFSILILPTLAAAQPFLDIAYDPDVPTLETAIGHAPGEAITTTTEILDYLDALQAAAPDRMQIVRYGETWQGRPLVYAVISAPENIARLDEI